MTWEHDAALFRAACPQVLGAAVCESPEPTLYASADGERSGPGIRRAFLRCYGVDIRRVRFVDGLRWPREGWCAAPAVPHSAEPAVLAEYVHVPAADPVERALVEFWEELLELRGIGVRDDYWECGGDSLGVVETAEFLARDFGVQLDFFEIGDGFTVARLATLVRERSPR